MQALVDAATAHGAGRYFNGGGTSLDLEAGLGREGYDQLLFADFLHQVLLYDRLLIASSTENNHQDIDGLVKFVNEYIRSELAARDNVFQKGTSEADFLSLYPPEWDGPDRALAEYRIMRHLCELVLKHATRYTFLAEVERLHIPAIYTTGSHHDSERFTAVCAETRLDVRWVPYGLYCFRGVCYAGMARGLTKKGVGTIYAASPGRISALEQILNEQELAMFERPLEDYADLMSKLDLPPLSYDFTFLDLPGPAASEVLAIAGSKSSEEAVKWAINQTQTKHGLDIRTEWASRLMTTGDTPLPAVVGPAKSDDRWLVAQLANRLFPTYS